MNFLELSKSLNITPAGLRHAIKEGRSTNAKVARELTAMGIPVTLSTGKRPPASKTQRWWNSVQTPGSVA